MIFYDFNASYDSGEINLVKTECDKMEQVGEKLTAVSYLSSKPFITVVWNDH